MLSSRSSCSSNAKKAFNFNDPLSRVRSLTPIKFSLTLELMLLLEDEIASTENKVKPIEEGRKIASSKHKWSASKQSEWKWEREKKELFEGSSSNTI